MGEILILLAATMLSGPDADAQAEQKPAAKDQLVCRRLGVTGSRVGTRRVCMTATEWDRSAQTTRETVAGAIDKVPSPLRNQ